MRQAKLIGKDLKAAEGQPLDCPAGGSIKPHEWPRYVSCTDFQTFRLTKLGDGGWTGTFPLEELADPHRSANLPGRQETVTHRRGRRLNRGIGHDGGPLHHPARPVRTLGAPGTPSAPGAYPHENRTWLLNTSLVTAR